MVKRGAIGLGWAVLYCVGPYGPLILVVSATVSVCVLISTRLVIAIYGALVSLIVVPSANGNDQHDKLLVNNLVDQPTSRSGPVAMREKFRGV